MKRVLLILLSVVLLAGCMFNRLPAVNYKPDMLPPYMIEVTFSNGQRDTLEVDNFRNVGIFWSGSRNSLYQIKPVGGNSWMTINNVIYIKILPACKKPERVKIQRTYNNPHNYNYNYWD